MPLKNSVVDDVQKDKVSSLPLRRSKRLNTNPSTLPKVLTKQELSTVEEIKSSVSNEVTTNLDNGITKVQDRTLTSICVQDSVSNDGTELTMKQNSANGSNEISDGFPTKRITRSQGGSRAKIDTKECSVILEVTNALQAASLEQKIDASNFDKANAVDSEKQVDGQISSKEEFGEVSSSKTSHEEQQITLDETIEELPISCNLNLNIKPTVDIPDGKDTMVFKADEFLGSSIEVEAPETTHTKNCVFENNEHKKQHEVAVNNSEEIRSQIVGKLEFSESPSLTNCPNEVLNITSETEARYSNELTDDVNGVDNRKSVSGSDVLDSSLDSSLEKRTVHEASIKENDIDSKIDHLLSSRISTSDDDENEPNPFISSMAEEGEEDTPSEGSNDIVEVGEEVNTTESEFSTDESYENDSFIDDKDDYQLLSGEEYDLSFEKTIKKSRIIKLSSGSDDDIVRICKPINKSRKIRKKSRIIKFSDSSDDEDAAECNLNENAENKENELYNSSLKENPNLCNDEPSQVTVTEKQTEVEKNQEITGISNNEDNKENLEVAVTLCNNESTATNMNHLSVNEYEKSKIEDASDFQQSNSKDCRQNEETFASIELNECNNMNNCSTSMAIVNVNVNMRTENNSVTDCFKVKNVDSKRLSDRINEVIDSLCSNITNISKIIISLSVDYSNNTEGFKNEVDESIQMKVAEDAIHKTKLSQDSLKKRRGRKRKIRKKKILPENREHEESNEPKSKKRKRENKGNKDPFINGNSSTKPLLLKNKKFKYNHEEKRSAPSTKIGKQLQEQNDYISKQKYVNNKRFTMVETGNEEFSKEIRVPMPENIKERKGKRRLKANKSTVSNLAMTILDEALFDVKNKKPSSINQDVQICEWDVNSVLVKPSSPRGLQKNKIQHDLLNENDNLDVQNKFKAKDFKNLMLYDASRIKRICTKKAITKRGLNA